MSLTELEYVKQQISLGRRLHFHDGVWWEQQGPFYCRPAFRFKKIVPGTARPGMLRRWMPYSHAVPERKMANRMLTYYAITRPALTQYDVGLLGSNKRKAVRRGISRCDIRILRAEELSRYKEDFREAVVSQAVRQQQDGFGLPPSYYAAHFEEWWQATVRLFTLPGRDVWGAFVSGKLIAYYDVLRVEEVANFEVMKVNTDYYTCYPVDGLYHTMICAYRDDPRCEMILNGGPSKASLDAFKELHQFKLTDIPIYTQGAGLYGLATKLMGAATAAKQRFAKRRASPEPAEAPEPTLPERND